MNETEKRPREPKIGEFVRGVGKLIAIQDRTPPPPPVPVKDHIFEEITARTELWLGDELLKEMGTLWDFHGLETSVKTATKEAKEYAAKRHIRPKSELEIRVIRIASQMRKHPKGRESFYDKQFIEFEAASHGCRYDLPEDVETLAWSSRQGQTVQKGN